MILQDHDLDEFLSLIKNLNLARDWIPDEEKSREAPRFLVTAVTEKYQAVTERIF